MVPSIEFYHLKRSLAILIEFLYVCGMRMLMKKIENKNQFRSSKCIYHSTTLCVFFFQVKTLILSNQIGSQVNCSYFVMLISKMSIKFNPYFKHNKLHSTLSSCYTYRMENDEQKFVNHYKKGLVTLLK